MQHLIDAFHDLPEYVAWLLSGTNLIWFVLALFAFLFVMFFNGKIAQILRTVVILALVVDAIISYVVYKNYPHVLICIGAILILLIYRFFVWLIVTLRERHVTKSFERRALEKAAMRRGEHKRDFIDYNSQGAGDAQSSEDNQAAGAASDTARVEDDTTVGANGNSTVRADGNGTAYADGDGAVSADGNGTARQADGNAVNTGALSRREYEVMLEKLEDLRAGGLLTESEFNSKMTELASRLQE